MNFTAAVITVSDKGFRGEREDTSGPNLCALLKEQDFNVIHTAIVPDEKEQIKAELLQCTQQKISLIVTTGGTGFSPRDITPEAAIELIERATPGIPEAMRAESMKITPKGCLSRSVAGIRDRSLIITLPGSKKASAENLLAVLEPLKHGLEMLLGEGSADCAAPATDFPAKQALSRESSSAQVLSMDTHSPSMDQWLREAKQHESAPKIGMYLTHNGIVRASAKDKVRFDRKDTRPVSGMLFSYDQEKVNAIIQETYALDGIYYIRVWLNEGHLQVGDDIMYVLIGGDIRPHVVEGLQYLVGRIKTECVTETELYE